MNKNGFAPTPPMGWNSYDYYDTTVNEEQIKANADYMAANMKEFGWEYIVVDIQWYAYDTGTERDRFQYIPFRKVEMDQYSRLLPCPDRFPSSTGGKGFKPLADYIHSLGLKFGIHIMRGIPRQAAHNHTAILGTGVKADKVADPSSICDWNPDMYGVFPEVEGAREYYDSLLQLYAEWDVDFIKCDDICRMDMPSAKKEIEMLYQAIEKCGRPIVLSLSPGPALVEEAWHYEKYANMWRITDDLWDNWPHLLNMFHRCELWQNHVSPGCYPDCDMLPFGYVGKGFDDERTTQLSKDEQITLMTLWCIFRSPLMLGAELTKMDDWTLELLTNRNVLRLLVHSKNARQFSRNESQAIWISEDSEEDSRYIGVFNLTDENESREINLAEMGFSIEKPLSFHELWTNEKFNLSENDLKINLAAHGAKLFKVS